jgi:hypothetical protein
VDISICLLPDYVKDSHNQAIGVQLSSNPQDRRQIACLSVMGLTRILAGVVLWSARR